MKRLGLEIPEYSPDVDPTKLQLTEPVLEWNISKADIKRMKVSYDKLLKDYKKRKADEKIKNGTKKMPKIKKWEDEKKLKDLLKLKSEIMKDETSENVSLLLNEENDDIFVE